MLEPSGNTSEENVFKNVNFISKLLGKSFPIFRGCRRGSREEEEEGEDVEVPYHGYDGLGDMENRHQYLNEEELEGKTEPSGDAYIR